MPVVETVAMFVADDVHVALAVMLPTVESEKVPVAVNCWVAPTGTDMFCRSERNRGQCEDALREH